MKTARRDRPERDAVAAPMFVEWPNGLFTARGNWYHVTQDSLRRFAAGVLERVPLERLLGDADAWVSAPRTLSLWVTLSALWFLSVEQAIALGLTVFVGVAVVGPGLVTLAGVRLVRWLEPVWVQAVAYVAVLSLLANQGNFIAMGVGLAAFILLRWGVIGWVTGPLVRLMHRRLYPLPVPDQVMRTLIVRWALSLGVSLPEIDRMESRMLELMHKRPRKKNTS